MKNLSFATIIEKNKVNSDTPFLVCLEVDVRDFDVYANINSPTSPIIQTLRLVNNSTDIVFRDQTYLAMPFSIDLREDVGEMSTLNINIDDYTGAVRQALQSYNGGIGFDVRLVIVNAARLDKEAEIREFFRIVSANTNDFKVSWQIGAENALIYPFPRRRQYRDRCVWRYKSAQCGYTGELPSCDLTLTGGNGCATHFNENRFGGFPGINPGVSL